MGGGERGGIPFQGPPRGPDGGEPTSPPTPLTKVLRQEKGRGWVPVRVASEASGDAGMSDLNPKSRDLSSDRSGKEPRGSRPPGQVMRILQTNLNRSRAAMNLFYKTVEDRGISIADI
jgi:hypothetical protein